jgi:hypothetical protein
VVRAGGWSASSRALDEGWPRGLRIDEGAGLLRDRSRSFHLPGWPSECENLDTAEYGVHTVARESACHHRYPRVGVVSLQFVY